MAENATEENTTTLTENKISMTSKLTPTNDTTVSSDKNCKQMDIDKFSAPKEDSTIMVEDERSKDLDLFNSEKQQQISQIDYNGDLQEPNLDRTRSETTESENAAPENVDSANLGSENAAYTDSDAKDSTKSNDSIVNSTAMQSSLNEILKIVHQDLAIEILQGAESTRDEVNTEEEEQRIEKKDDIVTDDTADSIKEYTSVTEDKGDSGQSSEKMEEKSNFGIVRSPTAIGELIEEQLANSSELSTDRTDHIVEWVKNSVKVNSNKENNDIEACKMDEAEKQKIPIISSPIVSPRKSQKIISSIIKKSIKCLNAKKMHANEGAAENKRKVDTAEDEKTSRSSPSPKVPQSQQNGAALPEETAAAPTASAGRGRPKKKDESRCETEASNAKSKQLLASTSRQNATASEDVLEPRHVKARSEPIEIGKRKSTNGQLTSLGNPRKKLRDNYTREEYISRIVGDDNESVEDLMAKADRLRADILALENLAHAKEMEWNEILRKRKLKEEAYLRLERKIQTTAYLENDGQLEILPSSRSSLGIDWENNVSIISKERSSFGSKEDLGEKSESPTLKKEKTTRASLQQRMTPPKTNGENSRKHNDVSSPESRQIGEGRQGTIVDVRSIIADHRLKHPETVPRRGRRMRNSNVNINLGAGGAMLETGHNADSRPSSTESCKSNPSASDSISYKDMLVQFNKAQQAELTKVPQNYPDVTLHPVTPSCAQNTSPTGSLLHGILTKAQTPRSTTFSPTLARLLTAPERERNSPAAAAAAAAASASMSQQSTTTQHLLQTYQGSNLARTEITITPVVNIPAQSHSNDLIQVEDVEEETTILDDRKGNSVIGRDGKQVVKDNPPSPNTPPKCQGCIIRPAQFVCAGCGNQWYCSRSCQLAAWTTHSDHCPPEPENNKTKSNV